MCPPATAPGPVAAGHPPGPPQLARTRADVRCPRGSSACPSCPFLGRGLCLWSGWTSRLKETRGPCLLPSVSVMLWVPSPSNWAPPPLWKPQCLKDLPEVTVPGRWSGRQGLEGSLALRHGTSTLPGLTGLCSHLPSLVLLSLLLTNHEPRLFLRQPQHSPPRIPAHEPQDDNGPEETAKTRTQELT